MRRFEIFCFLLRYPTMGNDELLVNLFFLVDEYQKSATMCNLDGPMPAHDPLKGNAIENKKIPHNEQPRMTMETTYKV